jgi:hypothetical protein
MRRTALLVLCALALCASVATAGVIQSVNCSNDGDGAITWQQDTPWAWNGADGVLQMNEILHTYPAHALADFVVEGDPIVTFWKEVQNDTNFAWTDYHINIIRQQNDPFTITQTANDPNWNGPVNVTQPTLYPIYVVDGNPLANVWVGSVDYFVGTGTPVAIGSTGLYKVQVSFANTANFCLEQIPTPEPGAIMLLGIGLGFAALRRRAAA